MTSGIDSRSYEIIRKWGYVFSENLPDGLEVNGVILVAHDERKKHDSGYPFIRVFGILPDNYLVDLGWHDHFLIECTVNLDMLGKNVTRIHRWNGKPLWKVVKNFIPTSSLRIKASGEID